MNFFKALFGGKQESSEEKKQQEEARQFDTLKYDGVRAMKSGEIDFAVKCFRHALSMKDDLEIHDYLSQALIAQNNLIEAYDELQIMAEAQPDNQAIFIRMANVAFMMEDYGALSNACEKAMLIDDSNAEVMYLYGRGCIGQDDDVNAVAMLTRAITLNDKFYDAYLLRSQANLRLEKIDEASADADFLLEQVGENEDVLLLKARIARAQGNDDDAIAFYGRVINENPFREEAYRERAELRRKSGDEQGAEEDLKKADEVAPEDQKSAEDQKIQQKVEKKYREMNPYGF
ncbi:MAG: hypothetical protein J5918_08270 [Prevotella sp.]|jgi:tetratricopeptide (TPR) repeat protein|nr:hypothetical protein [Prevotella sp.]MBR1621641.1 hypothetical protein [Prevotella sp.]